MLTHRTVSLLIYICTFFYGCSTTKPAYAEDTPPIPLPQPEAKCRTSTAAEVVNICVKGLGCHWYTSVSPPPAGRHMPGIMANSVASRITTKSKEPAPSACVPKADPILLICDKESRHCVFFQKVPGGNPVSKEKHLSLSRPRFTFFDIVTEHDICSLRDLFVNPISGAVMRESPVEI